MQIRGCPEIGVGRGKVWREREGGVTKGHKESFWVDKLMILVW